MSIAYTAGRAVRRHFLISLTLLFAVAVTACGGGGGGGDTTPAPPTTISGSGVKGPLANASVTVYALNTSAVGFKGTAIALGTTNAAAQIIGLKIPATQTPPFLLEFTSTATTWDITTGHNPVIGTLRTVLTQELINSGQPIYASPLTTMATDIAIANADSNVGPFTGNNNGSTSTTEFLNALPIAAAQVVSTVGFGATGVDIWDTPPIIDSTTTSATQQTAVAAYRTAIEALTAVVVKMSTTAGGTVTPASMFAELTADLGDGVIDGSIGGTPSTIINAAVLSDLTNADPGSLTIPDTTIPISDIESVLVAEKATTGVTTPTTVLESGDVFNPVPAETNPSLDGDTIPDSIDNCPATANQNQLDANSNGVGDACESAPVAVDDSITVDEGGTATTLTGGAASVLNNDTDAEGDSLTVALVSSTANGSMTLNANGTFSYTHNGSETTTDSFTYRINDGASNSNTATVSITVNPVDDPAVLSADTNSITENAIPNTVTGNVFSNDNDPDTALTISNTAALNGSGTYGSLTIDVTGTYTYALNNSNPAVTALNNGDSLTETYTYQANGQSTTLTITINGADDGTVIVADTNSINEDAVPNTVTGNVLSNDIDPDTVLTVSNVAAISGTGSYGTLTIDATGFYTYALNNSNTTVNALVPGGSLNEVYTYQINGGPTSTLTITIHGVDDATILTADTASITEDAVPNTVSGNILSNDTDPDTALTVSNSAALNGTGIYGTLTIDASGAYTYTLDNSNATVNALTTGSLTETYTYLVNGGPTSTLTITINGTDDATTLTADTASITEDAVPNTVTGDVLGNDTDSDTTLTVTNAGTLTGSYGSLSLAANGIYTYTLDNSNATVNALTTGSLTETFTYQVNGGPTSTLTITIHGYDDPPILTADIASITEDAVPNTVSGNVLGNDTDPDTTLTVTNAGTLTGVYGSLSLAANGIYTYTLDNGNATVNALNIGSSIADSFTYMAGGQSATLTITINGANDNATLTADTARVSEDAPYPVTGNVLSNDSDPDTTLTVTNVADINSTGTYGTLTIAANGDFSYAVNNSLPVVQNLNFGNNLTETYTYSAAGFSTTLTITINGVNENVTTTPDTNSIDENATPDTVTGNVLTNDSDPDATSLVVSNADVINGSGTYGTLTIAADGSYSYQLNNASSAVNALNAGDTLTEVYNYEANGQASTLTITINGFDDPFVATADVNNIYEDAVPNTVTGNVTSNDDPDTALTVTNAGALNGTGNYGSLSISSGGAYTYTLDNGIPAVNDLNDGGTLEDVYTYDVFDGVTTQSTTLTITIHGVTDAP